VIVEVLEEQRNNTSRTQQEVIVSWFSTGRLVNMLEHRSETVRSMTKALLSSDDPGMPLIMGDVVLEHQGEIEDMVSIETGHNYLFLTVTHYFVGTVVEKNFTDIKVKNISWIPETGQFSEVMRTGNLAEAESAPADMECIINTPVIVCAFKWPHPLPQQSGRRSNSGN